MVAQRETGNLFREFAPLRKTNQISHFAHRTEENSQSIVTVW